MKRIALALLVILTSISNAQNQTISGFLADSSSGEKVLYSTVIIEELGTGTTVNEYGYYSISVPKGNFTVLINQMGFKTYRKEVKVDGNIKLDIFLSPEVQNLGIVEIKVEKKESNENIKKADAGTMDIDIKELDKIPVVFGEKDILKTIQLLPGVSTTGEASSGLFVRGGNADQNLILLDEAPIYNASHVLGFFSIFNSDALKDMKIYKAGAPAKYGGRSSSVLDIRMKEGNNKSYHGTAGIGLISSRFNIEGPIVKEKGSFIVSGRRTYADLFLKAAKDPIVRNTKLYFYDLNLKANYSINEKNKIFFSGYLGNDVFQPDSLFSIIYGNKTSTLRWNHLFSSKLFMNTTAIYSKYNFSTSERYPGIKNELKSGIENITLKQDYTYFLNNSNKLKFGWDLNNQKFIPSIYTRTELGEEIKYNTTTKQGVEASLYGQNDQKIGEHIQLNYGIRISSIHLYGPAIHYDFNDAEEVTKTYKYDNNKFYKSYYGFEPRFNSSFQINENSSIKSSFARMYQYSNRISHSTAGTPFDYWLPVSLNIKPGITDQGSIGYHRNFANNKFESFVEVYYKDMKNLIDYKDGAETFITDSIESQIEYGKGRAFGLEVFLKKRTGKFTGWLSYTLSQSERQFDNINSGNWFHARQSRTHDFSIVGMYDLSDKISLSASWIFYTGDAITTPNGTIQIDNQIIQLFTERNGGRNPNYHRLDLGMNIKLARKEKYESDLNISIYNAYNKFNPFSTVYTTSPSNPNKTVSIQTAILPFLPSISYNLKF